MAPLLFLILLICILILFSSLLKIRITKFLSISQVFTKNHLLSFMVLILSLLPQVLVSPHPPPCCWCSPGGSCHTPSSQEGCPVGMTSEHGPAPQPSDLRGYPCHLRPGLRRHLHTLTVKVDEEAEGGVGRQQPFFNQGPSSG